MEKHHRYVSWPLGDEMSFIDDSINGLPLKERVLWLERYLGTCLKRKDWGDMDGQKVVNYIEHVLLSAKLMAMNLKQGVCR